MKIKKAYRFRLKIKPVLSAKRIEGPVLNKVEGTTDYFSKLAQFAGCVRFVWNKGLSIQKARLDNKQCCLSYNQLAGELKQWKHNQETSFLRDVHSQILQQALKDLDKALREAFDKKNPKKFPKFKKKGRGDSFRYPQGFKLDGDRVFLPKIGWMKFFNSQPAKGNIKQIIVSRRGEHWYISVHVELEIPTPKHPSTSMVGIDVGITRFATLSTGEYKEPINSFRSLEKKLAYKQRSLARKKRGSNNRTKQKLKIQKIHEHITNVRLDYLHKCSDTICKNHAIVVLEDLLIQNMSASARGTQENPGRHVQAKAGLNKSIQDQGWYELRRQLEYKQQWRGGRVIYINPKNSSRRCNVCGYMTSGNRTSQARFSCKACGHTENADLNAAKNILAAGHAVLACGDIDRVDGLAQEPSRVLS